MKSLRESSEFTGLIRDGHRNWHCNKGGTTSCSSGGVKRPDLKSNSATAKPGLTLKQNTAGSFDDLKVPCFMDGADCADDILSFNNVNKEMKEHMRVKINTQPRKTRSYGMNLSMKLAEPSIDPA